MSFTSFIHKTIKIVCLINAEEIVATVRPTAFFPLIFNCSCFVNEIYEVLCRLENLYKVNSKWIFIDEATKVHRACIIDQFSSFFFEPSSLFYFCTFPLESIQFLQRFRKIFIQV